ncbi:hypothetical protein TNCV_942661 [Trichonephila clavipes]|nr:hypothetical protein TNCV_942661 [Trichonephila clavipes]
MAKKICKKILDDCRLKVRELTDLVRVSKSAVHRILSENSDMRKIGAAFAHTPSKNSVSIECLAKLHSNKAELLQHFMGPSLETRDKRRIETID